jgi:N-acetylglucosamine-6-phosphate deacetylase
LEGPYLSRKQAGAQCADFITAPQAQDYMPLLEEYGDMIIRWSYAPENDEGEQFAKALSEHGVVAAAGHTDAIYDDLMRAKENGCNLITHLYSCTSTVTRDHGFRRLGVIETAYLCDDIYVEIICDGKHLPPELIKLIYKIKGADKIALITDSLALAGTEQTHGFMQSTEFIIEDGVCKLMDRSAFAGSIATADRLLRVAVKEAGISIRDGGWDRNFPNRFSGHDPVGCNERIGKAAVRIASETLAKRFKVYKEDENLWNWLQEDQKGW